MSRISQKTAHVAETDLALYVSNDLPAWRRVRVGLHFSRCRWCRQMAEIYRDDRLRFRETASQMPPGVNWNKLSAEITANIRVGLAAGECVAPRKRKAALGWRPAAAMAGLAALLICAWVLNMPSSTTQELGRAFTAIWSGSSLNGVRGINPARDNHGLVVELSSSGIELRENGSTVLGVSRDQSKLVDVSASVEGSASARYVDDNTGQMTITSVYAQ
ncbi:MAG TPA: hypothetical protein VKX39_09730 [Bryobacteraceae bacterium]|jgi:hypothetical protein|nr:hypothetical protein [Bryobacteraceae bacterium]